MKPSIRRMIVVVYFVSQLLGLVAFSFNYDTGQVKTKLFITVYSAIISVLMFGTVPLLFRIQWKPRNANGPELHYKITAVMCLIRIVAVLITVILNWSKRMEFMQSIKQFQMIRKNLLDKFQMPLKVQRYYERGIQQKFYSGLISNIIVFLTSYDILRGVFDVESPLIITFVGIVATVLNVIMTHYYFALLNINALLTVVNEELKAILNSSATLFKLQRLKRIRPGFFITACCQLADNIDELACFQYDLQLMGQLVNKMYEVQGACVLLTLYLNNISVIYMFYMVVQHEQLSQDFGWAVILIVLPLTLACHYIDLNIFMMNILKLVDLCSESGQLLKDRQPWLPTLDERFEKSVSICVCIYKII